MPQLITPADFEDWRFVELQSPAPNEEPTAFYDLDRLRGRFAPQTADVPEITIEMPALDTYDDLASVHPMANPSDTAVTAEVAA